MDSTDIPDRFQSIQPNFDPGFLFHLRSGYKLSKILDIHYD